MKFSLPILKYMLLLGALQNSALTKQVSKQRFYGTPNNEIPLSENRFKRATLDGVTNLVDSTKVDSIAPASSGDALGLGLIRSSNLNSQAVAPTGTLGQSTDAVSNVANIGGGTSGTKDADNSASTNAVTSTLAKLTATNTKDASSAPFGVLVGPTNGLLGGRRRRSINNDLPLNRRQNRFTRGIYYDSSDSYQQSHAPSIEYYYKPSIATAYDVDHNQESYSSSDAVIPYYSSYKPSSYDSSYSSSNDVYKYGDSDYSYKPKYSVQYSTPYSSNYQSQDVGPSYQLYKPSSVYENQHSSDYNAEYESENVYIPVYKYNDQQSSYNQYESPKYKVAYYPSNTPSYQSSYNPVYETPYYPESYSYVPVSEYTPSSYAPVSEYAPAYKNYEQQSSYSQYESPKYKVAYYPSNTPSYQSSYNPVYESSYSPSSYNYAPVSEYSSSSYNYAPSSDYSSSSYKYSPSSDYSPSYKNYDQQSSYNQYESPKYKVAYYPSNTPSYQSSYNPVYESSYSPSSYNYASVSEYTPSSYNSDNSYDYPVASYNSQKYKVSSNYNAEPSKAYKVYSKN